MSSCRTCREETIRDIMLSCWVSFLEPIIHSHETQKAECFGVPEEISCEIEQNVRIGESSLYAERLYDECVCKIVYYIKFSMEYLFFG